MLVLYRCLGIKQCPFLGYIGQLGLLDRQFGLSQSNALLSQLNLFVLEQNVLVQLGLLYHELQGCLHDSLHGTQVDIGVFTTFDPALSELLL